MVSVKFGARSVTSIPPIIDHLVAFCGIAVQDQVGFACFFWQILHFQ